MKAQVLCFFSILLLAVIVVLSAAGCLNPPEAGPAAKPIDPAQGIVPLAAHAGWDGFLLFDNHAAAAYGAPGAGIWTAGAYQVYPQTGTLEVVGLDDRGRCLVLSSYSGKWTPTVIAHDGGWLGGLAHNDVDARIPGYELYTGGLRGNLYQIVAYPHGALDCRLIAHYAGREIHTIVAGDVDPGVPGKELLVFTRPGAIYRVTPTGPDGTFESEHVTDLGGRVRDAVVLPAPTGSTPEIATVSRTGQLDLLRLTSSGLQRTIIHLESMGMGRIALRSSGPGRAAVLYATLDDGRVLRFERTPSGDWNGQTIFSGPQGPRGLAAGRFYADPEIEAVALFGYSAEVILLSRKGQGTWHSEIIFKDRDKGHWLCAAELDGRNGTLEIIGSGYGGRIFMLARPPGYASRQQAANDS